jgi:hypothetical protein
MRLATICLMVMVPLAARGADPKFEYGKLEEVKLVVWKVNVSVGALINTGNSNNASVSASGFASRMDGKNKLTLDVGGAFARSTTYGPTELARMQGFIASEADILATEQTTTAMWGAKFRYDRFFTANNSLYVSAFAAGNEPAGRRVAAGGQVGYARQLVKTLRHALALEAGFDYTFENLVADNTPNLHIASLRVFMGYGFTFNDKVGLVLSCEYLGNLNPYTSPYGPMGPYGEDINPFVDSRVTAKTVLNAKLWKWLTFRFSFTVLFDNVPAPRGPIPGGVPYAPGVILGSQTVDTITDIALVFAIL